MKTKLNKKGQSTLEYAVLVVVIIGALIAMQVYVKRGVQGKMRESTDQIGEQFSPGYTQYSKTSTARTVSDESQTPSLIRTAISVQDQSRSMAENVANETNEYWAQ